MTLTTEPSEGVLLVHADEWEAGRYPEIERGWVSGRYGHPFRTCWFCGSIHPQDLLNWHDDTWWLEWADQKYGYPHKMYVQKLLNPEQDRIFVMGSTDSRTDPRAENRGGLDWHRVDELPDDLRALALAEGYITAEEAPPTPLDLQSAHRSRYVAFGPRKTLHAKFYTKHYKDPEIPESVKNEIMKRSALWMEFFVHEETGQPSVFWMRYEDKYPIRTSSTQPILGTATAPGFGTTPQ